MTEIIPAVIAKNYIDLNKKLAKFINIANIIQIDVCDGVFVDNVSWPMDKEDITNVEEILNEEEGMPFWKDVDYEFDLMVSNAHKKFDFFSRLGARRIVFHLEAEEEESFKEFLGSIDPYFRDNLEIGIAINIDTNIKKLEPFINYIDFIQCMGIRRIGYQGEPFDEEVLSQIRKIRKIYPEIKISVDGAVNESTIAILKEAGADRFVVGSAFSNSLSIRDSFKEFENF